MTTYLLDTSIASHIIRGDRPRVAQRLLSVSDSSIVISVITEAELRYGVVKRGGPAGLKRRVENFLMLVAVLPWTRDVAIAYASMRVKRELAGAALAPLDLLIAAHAYAVGATLVSCDRAFGVYPAGLVLEDWTQD
ncbi:PIN domain-containing protein [Duganella sp. CY15W]|uniref:PIN domain-containing protein n=1 Tax=Duganella sp. CY15W TaxID=2692172 RepID=UPI00136A272C|nr:PIN domain-containing protein [Duganella sp. CY15W]MYM30722.1 PIN domain-containing protein [Duganella sp. CY15W]